MEGRLDPIGRNRRPTEHAAVSACCGLRKPSGNGTDHDRRQSCSLSGRTPHGEDSGWCIYGRPTGVCEWSETAEIPEKETEETEVEPEQEVNETEQRQKELREIIEEYNQQKQDPDYYYLPDQWDGQKLIWQKSGDQTGSLLASLAFFAAFVVMLKKAKEQQEEMAKRAEQLLMDYPSLIMKFTLLIQAGMTARKVFQKMSADYMRNRSKTGRYAYEAITIMCHEMDSGVAEMEAYRRFGERCGQMKYKTFSTILIQNLQKGSHRMADLLEKEALEAWDERKRKARVLGETAATKLLVPMVMMLAVVMAIIMIPAFLSFYG